MKPRTAEGGQPVSGTDPLLHCYLSDRIAAGPVERLHVVWCDTARRYIADELVAIGEGGRIAARLRPLIQRALALNAGAFLLAHNHPSGDCRPSADDLAATRRIAHLAWELDLELIDHLVVTRRKVFSMRAAGLL